MKFEELGLETGKTLLLLPGTACTWQINFAMVIDDLKERYHLICVNYDGFDGDNSQPFTDMITVTEKIEAYILQHHGGHVDGAYEQRYLEHFRDPDIIPFDMPHEAWLFSKTWKQPVLEAINNLMISDQKGVSTL